MKLSIDRILTTHVGSLPRPDDLFEMMLARMDGSSFDEKAYAERLHQAVVESVTQQVDVGLDVISDGEMGKPSFITYAAQRLGGLEKREGVRPSPFSNTRETKDFPEYYKSTVAEQVSARRRRALMVCTGPIIYKGHDQLRSDLDLLKSALKGSCATEAFVPAIAPSNVETTTPNEYYPTSEAYVFAIAEAMREEYKAIIDAGFLLQIDDPFLVTYYITRPDLSIAECRKWAELRVEALNAAIAGIPADRIRFHTCYSVNMGPRIHDMQLKDIIDIVLKVRAGGYTFEAANPRHEHEWEEWKRAKLPDDKVLIPGVITQSTVLVEHPELVAQRISRFADIVGRERVIAGADCGFASFAGSNEVHPSIVWAKFSSLVEGSRIASKRLWAKSLSAV
ncbi:MAG TPA: cobalamin-independent methionine synthase II family protein [Beijerinckiaceae bacterium]|jgi:5-methyltetrahydropteroyltriglutamate--homocysteine methyltransferase|nr:cobalamin-independent methionine synthase II family protein [Beijerinckiaceae bacterium]